MQADYLIVGGGIAAARAVEGIRAKDPVGRLVLVTEEGDPPYFRPLISYLLAGKVGEQTLLWRPESFWAENRVRLITGSRVTALDAARRTALLAAGEEIRFERLLLATGSRPVWPALPGRELSGVFTFTTWQDVTNIRSYLSARRVEQAVVIGGGLIGLKAAEALAVLGIKVTIVELQAHLLPAALDAEGAELLKRHLVQRGWNCLLGRRVGAIEGPGQVAKVSLDDGTVLPADLVVVATGVRPNRELAQAAGLAVRNGIVVNEYLETSQSGIYAAGDVAEAEEALSGQKQVLALWPIASRQGYTAGLNLAGMRKPCPPGIPMNATTLAGLPLVTVGLARSGEQEGLTVLAESRSEDWYYRKLVFRGDKLVGAIFIGQVARAGILTGLIRAEEALPEPLKRRLLTQEVRLLDLPARYRENLWRWAWDGGGQGDAA